MRFAIEQPKTFKMADLRPLLFTLLTLSVFTFAAAQPGKARELLHSVPGKPMAQDFELPDLDGNKLKLSDFKGHIVIVNFWATWCPPCREEIPSMQRAWTILKKKNVVMLAVHVGGNEDKVWSFLTDFEIDFPVLMDKSSKISRQWRVVGLPSTLIIDPQGRIALGAIGGRKWDDPSIIASIMKLAE
ncbi:MAG: TlpA family protein disulfide reductase [Hyphomicrobiaceae bacterium]|nr:TlpA family protein disulfide reductase [Hyphomicrobiaceae bacterium]